MSPPTGKNLYHPFRAPEAVLIGNPLQAIGGIGFPPRVDTTTAPCMDDDPEWASLDWVMGTANGGILTAVQLVGEPNAVQLSNPAFGICAFEIDSATKHKARKKIICDIFFISFLS